MKKLGLCFFILLLFACTYQKPSLPEGANSLALQKASFKDLQNFQNDKLLEGLLAFEKSCEVILKKNFKPSKSLIVFPLKKYQEACVLYQVQKPTTNTEARAFLEQNFRPYLVVFKDSSQGKFTSYYEAEIKASRIKHGRYQYPVYGKPDDLIEFNPKIFDESLPSRRLLGRIEKNRLVPYYTRAEIEKAQNMQADVILWANDPVDIFLMQIQGSAIAKLDDGSEVRVRYAENNGHPFVGIGSILLKEKVLKKGKASMDNVRDWLKNNPDKAQKYMHQNPRFVFHQFSDAKGPVGALGATLTAGRSLAVDKDYIPLGSLLWLETTAPNKKPLQKLVAAQDIGSAIKGAIRGDYFWGHGEEAFLWAGKMHAEGQYYILLPKDWEPRLNE